MTVVTARMPLTVSAGKFIVPARLPDLLRRADLLDFLYDNIHRKLVLIAAAAGYGKSSLLIDFAHDTEYPVAWYQLDSSDSELSVLVSGLVASMQRLYPDFESVAPRLAARPDANPADLAQALIREIETTFKEYFIVILDDFHFIEHSPAIILFFDALLAGLPEQAHLIIAGRTLPPIQLVSLVARQQAEGLGEDRLRFRAAEVKALAEKRGRLDLTDADAERLVANSEGWITGILLTTHLMRQGAMSSLFQGRNAESIVYDFLADEVLDREPEPLQRFLIESAVLPDMDPPTCDQVLGRDDSQTLLREAAARHLFVITVGDEFPTYQYHHLFRDFLLTRLRDRHPQRLQDIQVRAAEWYASHGMPEAAVTFYVAAGRPDKAAEIAQLAAQKMFVAGRLTTLQQWVEQLSSVKYDIARVHLYLAKLQADVDRQAAEHTLEIAAEGFGRRRDEHGLANVQATRAWLAYGRGEYAQALSLAKSYLPQAQALDMLATAAIAVRQIGLCESALGHIEMAEASFRQSVEMLRGTPNQYDLAMAYEDLANILRIRGQTAQSIQAQQQALKIWRELGAPGPLATSLNNVGFDFHMLGLYDNALATYREALEWAQKGANTGTEAMLLAGQGDIFVDLGGVDLAWDLYQQAMAKADRIGHQGLLAYLYRAMARLNRMSGNFVGALEWLRRSDLTVARLYSALAGTNSLRGIILVEMGRIAEGRDLLENTCLQLRKSGALVDLAQALFFNACAHFRVGAYEAAVKLLTQAFDAAVQVGYDQMLVAEALSGRDLLEAASSHPNVGALAKALLKRAEGLGAIHVRLTNAAPAPAQISQAALEVQALGPGRLFKDGVELPKTAWEYKQPRELFFFILDRAPIARMEVLQAFWPESPLARASANLRNALYRIRRTIEYDVISVADNELKISEQASINYDARQFESQARAALELPLDNRRRLELLASASDLYRGEYLSDISADWARERRRALGELGVTLLREYVDELMRLTRFNEAQQALKRAIDFNPLQDDLHERMLHCLAKMGRRHEVIKHYMDYKEKLRNDLGIDPPPEIRALYARLIA